MDWAGLMRLGLKDLGLIPSDFWRLTPVELLIKLGSERTQAPLTRARLDDLTRAFPDSRKGERDG